MTISVSTFFFSFSIPFSAFVIRVRASNRKGLVTTPTVRQPISLARPATTGAAPVPVPPPIPQVTNTMSAPSNSFLISSTLSSAAFSPTSGLAPAPSPLVTFSPIWRTVGALQRASACLSVLIPTNSTPPMPSSTMRLTALFPAPPTPITTILAEDSASFDMISNKTLPPLCALRLIFKSDYNRCIMRPRRIVLLRRYSGSVRDRKCLHVASDPRIPPHRTRTNRRTPVNFRRRLHTPNNIILPRIYQPWFLQ